MNTNGQGLLDEILSSIDEEETLGKTAEEHSPESVASAVENTQNVDSGAGLSMLTKEAKEATLVDRLMNLSEDTLLKTAESGETGILLKVAEDTVADMEDLHKQAAEMGRLAAAEFLAAIEEGR